MRGLCFRKALSNWVLFRKRVLRVGALDGVWESVWEVVCVGAWIMAWVGAKGARVIVFLLSLNEYVFLRPSWITSLSYCHGLPSKRLQASMGMMSQSTSSE